MLQDRSWLADFEQFNPEEQAAVIDFVQYLKFKKARHAPFQKQSSFLDGISDLVGCVEDAPTDLSSNPAYMQHFGK